MKTTESATDLLDKVTDEALKGLGCSLKVRADNDAMRAFAVGLARLYKHEDRLIAAGKVDMGSAFFVQPGMAPTFWPFFGYGRDREAMEGWWEYAHRHDEIRNRWWESLLARLLTGQAVKDLDGHDGINLPPRRGPDRKGTLRVG